MDGIDVFVKRDKGRIMTNSLMEDLFSSDWNFLSHSVERRILGLLHQTCVDISTHVTDTYNNRTTSSQGQIPTSLLLASVNTPDHAAMYAQINTFISNQGGHVAVIEVGSDTSSAKAIIASIVQQFITAAGDQLENIGASPPKRCSSQQVTRKTTSKSVLSFLPPSLRSTYFAISLWYNRNKMPSANSLIDRVDALCINEKNKPASIIKSTEQTTPKKRAPLQPMPASLQILSDNNNLKKSPCGRSLAQGRRMTAQTPTLKRSSCAPVADPVASLSGPLVIVIPSIEMISAVVLRDFVEVTSLYTMPTPEGPGSQQKRQLPICFVFGLSSTADLGLEARCDAQTLSRLAIKRFQMPSPSTFLDSALTELIHVPGFRMSRNALSFLIDSIYICLDYSIKNLLKRFKISMLTHYQSLSHPELLMPLQQAKAYLESISDSELAILLSTYPSLLPTNVLNGCGELKEKKKSVSVATGTNDGAALPPLRDRLIGMLRSHWLTQLLLPFIFNWLLTLLEDVPTRPFASTLTELYRDWVVNDLVTSKAFSQTVLLFKILDKTRVIAAIDSSVGSIQASIGVLTAALQPTLSKKRQSFMEMAGASSLLDDRWQPLIPEAIGQLKAFKKDLCNWRQRLLHTENTHKEEQNNQNSASSTQMATDSLKVIETHSTPTVTKRMTLQKLREQLQNSPSSLSTTPAKTSSDPFTVWRTTLDEFFAWVQDSLSSTTNNRCLIQAPQSMPLHEVFYGPPSGEAAILRRRIDPPLQKSIHLALFNPAIQLKCPQLALTAPEAVEPHLPDLCILYKLHLEAGKLINLYDWLVAFATVIGDSNGLNEAPSQVIQCRFLRGISEMEYLGFIKSTKRKVDHVSRLTFTGLLN